MCITPNCIEIGAEVSLVLSTRLALHMGANDYLAGDEVVKKSFPTHLVSFQLNLVPERLPSSKVDMACMP
jgi:hypothetical protein